MKTIFRAMRMISLVAISMLIADSSVAGWDAGWALGNGRYVLFVRNGGDVGIADSCPEYRWRHSYSDIRAAVNCAKDGDKIRFVPGEIYDGGPDGPLGTIIVDKNLSFIGRHRVGDAVSVILARFEIHADVSFNGLVILHDSRSTSALRGGLIETMSAGAHAEVSFCHLVGGEASEGGAIMVNEDTEVVIENSVLTGNTATVGVGAGGAVFNNGTLTFYESQVFANNAVYGGGIYNTGDLYLVATAITGNNAQSTGGGVASENDRVFLWDKSFVGANQPDDSCDASGLCVNMPVAFCGNGETDPGEACDDGNAIDNDGCSTSCQTTDACHCIGFWAAGNIQAVDFPNDVASQLQNTEGDCTTYQFYAYIPSDTNRTNVVGIGATDETSTVCELQGPLFGESIGIETEDSLSEVQACIRYLEDDAVPGTNICTQ